MSGSPLRFCIVRLRLKVLRLQTCIKLRYSFRWKMTFPPCPLRRDAIFLMNPCRKHISDSICSKLLISYVSNLWFSFVVSFSESTCTSAKLLHPAPMIIFPADRLLTFSLTKHPQIHTPSSSPSILIIFTRCNSFFTPSAIHSVDSVSNVLQNYPYVLELV